MISTQHRTEAVKLIKEAQTNGARLELACKELGISVRTYERWVQNGSVRADGRPNAIRPEPRNKLSKEERQEIIKIVNQEEYASLPPTQIVPNLADKGTYLASESTFYRILRSQNMQHHRGRSKNPESRTPTTHKADGPNQVWTWDISWLPGPIRGMYYRLYMIMDIFSRKIIGWEVWETETGENASTLMKRAILSEGIKGQPLVLHSDNGSPMKATTFLVLLEKLGVKSSFSRPRVSNDNPYSESLFRTCKYRPDYPYKGFKTITTAREWVKKFVEWYNNKHHHSGLNFITPQQRHKGLANQILANRKKVYEEARQRYPQRWSRGIRNWTLPTIVTLNPEKS
jgi:putative transposase